MSYPKANALALGAHWHHCPDHFCSNYVLRLQVFEIICATESARDSHSYNLIFSTAWIENPERFLVSRGAH